MPRVAFYTRISTDELTQKYSLPAQEERLEAYCKGQYGDDWTLFNVYRDTASGTTMERPELQRMVADARDRLFDLIMVFRVDRFSRRVGELATLANELKSYGVDLKSATEPIDTSSPAGMMIFQTLGVFAEFEQKSIVERTKMGMLKKAKTGSWPGGRVPLGYRFESDRGLLVDEGEAPIIRRVYEMYVDGRSGSGAIAQELNQSGFRTRHGKKFTRKAILDILRNPMYRGQFKWQKEVFDSQHEPIIAKDIFEAASEILQKRSDEAPGKRWHNKDDRILSGLIRCGCCRSRMVGVSANKKGQKFSYYACRKRLESKECDQEYIRAEWLEQQILADIQLVFRDEALLDEVWQSAQQQLAASAPELDAQIQAVGHQRNKTQAAADRYFQAFEAGTMAPAACNQRVADLTTQLQQLDDQRADLEDQRVDLDLPALRTDFLHEILTNLAAVVDAVPNAQKKHLLRLLVEKVLIRDRCTFEVWYRLPQFPAVRTLSPLVAPKGQCTNHRRRVRQSLSARAVFLIDARYGCGRESVTGGCSPPLSADL